MGCAGEPSKLPALQTGQPGLQGPDEVRVGWRGEEWAGSETIARFLDHRLLPSDKLRSSEETRKKDWKKFREESQPNRELWTAWSYCPSQAREREHAHHVYTRSQSAHSHSCIHTRGLVHTHTDAPSEAQHFIVYEEPSLSSSHLILRDGETVPELV